MIENCPQRMAVVVTGRNREVEDGFGSIIIGTFLCMFMGLFVKCRNLCGRRIFWSRKPARGPSAKRLSRDYQSFLYSRMPGQEDGNVEFVLKEGAGLWAPNPDQAAEAVRLWLEHPNERERAQENCQRLARPQAARQFARLLG